jgi:hypothetical protein
MCGKKAAISDEHDNNKNERATTRRSRSFNMIIEEINGTYHTFDTAECALMFKKIQCCIWKQFCR